MSERLGSQVGLQVKSHVWRALPALTLRAVSGRVHLDRMTDRIRHAIEQCE